MVTSEVALPIVMGALLAVAMARWLVPVVSHKIAASLAVPNSSLSSFGIIMSPASSALTNLPICDYYLVAIYCIIHESDNEPIAII